MKWHIGCSGFSYSSWKPFFYPAGVKLAAYFNYYSQNFNTLELNVTFYKMPTLTTFQKWYDTSPVGFSFSVKAPRLITHYKGFADCEAVLADFYGTIRSGLRDKVGCILFQTPPKFAFSIERLHLITGILDSGFNNAIEFRHPGWWNPVVVKALADHGISFVSHSHPLGLPDEPLATAPVLYYRFHGVPLLFTSLYPQEKIKSIADQIMAIEAAEEAYVFFNNTSGTAGIENALWLRSYVGK